MYVRGALCKEVQGGSSHGRGARGQYAGAWQRGPDTEGEGGSNLERGQGAGAWAAVGRQEAREVEAWVGRKLRARGIDWRHERWVIGKQGGQ